MFSVDTGTSITVSLLLTFGETDRAGFTTMRIIAADKTLKPLVEIPPPLPRTVDPGDNMLNRFFGSSQTTAGWVGEDACVSGARWFFGITCHLGE